jgi:diazepam-binding inhibitor (GABA receptor modulating acyl-CoA-binding protein)
MVSADLQTHFEQAATAAQKLASRPDNDSLLQLYALYKQATGGDATGTNALAFSMW